jgi:hypothetical protein
MSDWPLYDSGVYQGGGAVTGSTTGTTITASGTANAKGSPTELISSTNYDACGIFVSVVDNSANAKYLLDIMIGPSGSETVLIPDIIYHFPRANQAGINQFFPIAIPAGSRISARCQCSTASSTLSVLVFLVSTGFASPMSLNRVTAYGVVAASSNGAVIDPGATANTKTIVQVVSSTDNPIKQIIIGIGQRANSAMTTCRWLWELLIGESGSEQVVIPEFGLAANTTDDDIEPPFVGPFPVSIPAGTRLAIRAQCSINDATDRLLDAIIYGID